MMKARIESFDHRIFSDLLNTGETPGRKVHPQRSFEPKLSLSLVQSSFANVNIVNAILAEAWAMAVVTIR
jgi:hypothetical protein